MRVKNKLNEVKNATKVLKFNLVDLRKLTNNHSSNNNILQKHGLTEQIVEFQKPVTETLKENNKEIR